jgi:hypothetical protein
MFDPYIVLIPIEVAKSLNYNLLNHNIVLHIQSVNISANYINKVLSKLIEINIAVNCASMPHGPLRLAPLRFTNGSMNKLDLLHQFSIVQKLNRHILQVICTRVSTDVIVVIAASEHGVPHFFQSTQKLGIFHNELHSVSCTHQVIIKLT